MGWELRAGKRYYYRKRRDDSGRVQSQYLGRGQKAVDASREDGVTVPDEVLALVGPVTQELEASGAQAATVELLTPVLPSCAALPYYWRAVRPTYSRRRYRPEEPKKIYRR